MRLKEMAVIAVLAVLLIAFLMSDEDASCFDGKNITMTPKQLEHIYEAAFINGAIAIKIDSADNFDLFMSKPKTDIKRLQKYFKKRY